MLKHIVPVVSGKGGVGKSTVAVNLAVALAARGNKVALVDGDFYGPSVPTLMGGGDLSQNHEGKLLPAEKYGVKYISLAFFLRDQDDAVIWRGPMFNKALAQMFQDVDWGEIDYCVVDMPPGTGDAQISLSQLVQITGALVVTTPQEVAMADVRKALNMLEKVNVPVLGVVENMGALITESGEKVELFGSGGGKQLAEQFGVPLAAELPLNPQVRVGGDSGVPIATELENPVSKIFNDIAEFVESSAQQTQSAQVQIAN